MKLLEEAVKEYYGERCPDHNPGCIVCQAWAEFDEGTAPHNKRSLCSTLKPHTV
jgi:hypothetical protein